MIIINKYLNDLGIEIEFIKKKGLKYTRFHFRPNLFYITSSRNLTELEINNYIRTYNDKILKYCLNLNDKPILHLWGIKYNLEFIKSSTNSYKIDINNYVIYIFYTTINKQKETIKKLYLIELTKKIEPYYNLMLDLFLKTFKNHSNMPKIKGIKYVKSYLGRCNTLNGEIEFSSRIAKYNIEIMRLVICHEFCHIFVPNHSKTFYLYLSKLCPDYKKLLKIEKENYQNIRYDYL